MFKVKLWALPVVSLPLMSFLLSFNVSAQDIYKCTNSDGEVIYNAKPCDTKQTEKKLKAVKDPKNITPREIPSVENIPGDFNAVGDKPSEAMIRAIKEQQREYQASIREREQDYEMRLKQQEEDYYKDGGGEPSN